MENKKSPIPKKGRDYNSRYHPCSISLSYARNYFMRSSHMTLSSIHSYGFGITADRRQRLTSSYEINFSPASPGGYSACALNIGSQHTPTLCWSNTQRTCSHHQMSNSVVFSNCTIWYYI